MSRKEVAIEIKNIHKEFILPQNKNTTFKQVAVNIVKKNNKVTQKVLDGVSFDINKGDFFGIVGKNGSGKSTLLKLIAGVYSPTAGEIKVNGGLTPFIELGVGFNPELSGRDNVYLNGALLGFNRKQMNAMYDDIVDFAELGQFMDQKLKNYSSGMQVRLAFSIAVKAKNDILIFDEVLAVGDEAFQRKCIDVFEQYKASGQTVVLVTHSMDTVRKFCNRAALIDGGKLLKIGNPNEVSNEYSRLNQTVIDDYISKRSKNNAAPSNVDISIIKNNKKTKANSFYVNEMVQMNVNWLEHEKDEKLILDIYRNTGENVSSITIGNKKNEVFQVDNKKESSFEVNLNLAPGGYYIAAVLVDKNISKRLMYASPVYEFSIINDWSHAKYIFNGISGLEHKISKYSRK